MTLPAGGQAIQPRWELTITGADGGQENGDLRLDGTTGRVLLQHADSAFQLLKDLRVADGRISFSVRRGDRRFEGTVTATRLAGTVRDKAGSESTWEAIPLSPDADRWPVPPRVVVRQLAMGSAATSERIPRSWLAAAPDSTMMEREYRELAGQTRMTPIGDGDRAARASLVSLGLDGGARAAARQLLSRVEHDGFDHDPDFKAIFRRDPAYTLDIHEQLPWEAVHYVRGFRLMQDPRLGVRFVSVADGLQALHELAAGVADSSMVRQSAWRFWSNAATDSVGTAARIDTLATRDEAAANQLRALLAGFDDALAWWRRAVSWLLTHAWLDTPAGPRSPAQLMAAFWGVDSLPLPEIRPTRFGGAAAMPSISVEHVAPFLFKPANGSAVEWLAQGGAQDAFAAWRPLRWGESPLTVVIGGRSATIASPSSQATVHPASFFGERDAILIDPGIMPLAAVAAFLHEWNHLLAAQHRLSGAHPAAVVQSAAQLQLREEDPWLAEGFAEWATDEVLRPAGTSAAFLRFTQAEKRLGIATSSPDDPHVLGFRLVRGAASGRRAPALRDLLLQNLHDLGAFARAVGLPAGDKGQAITLQRPPTAIVIPEVTFTWDEGTTLDLSRRLVIPNIRSEH